MDAQFARKFVNTFQSKLEPPVRSHLKNVYACLTLSTLVSGLAAWLGLAYPNVGLIQPGFLTQIGGVGLLIGLMATRNSKQNQPLRMGMLAGLAYCIGTNLVPLLDVVIQIDPSIVVTALLSTSVVFISFSMCALLSNRGKWLFLGAPLLSLMNVMLLLTVVSLFTGSFAAVYNVNIYLGLLAMCGFVLFDTQLIVEKRLMGDDDFIAHSVDLFIDLVGIFRRLLVILTKKEQDNRNKNKRE
ncbi:bax inhibitor 1 [Neocloeon triangulifer]|uniref:bax inhibitor 1 n=1 Tax=Neocloeon triangulifer TaxID=2078957 RepID=UPI00286EC624|nr:bax inhibitor 1 [Neocloeon triangulifer]XP_059488663.1 bax inhibitor 1 [Neocloeon triangulifer]